MDKNRIVWEHLWHNLMKNPDDYPKKDGVYWVHGVWGSGKHAEGDCEYKVNDGYFRTAWNFSVTAWRVMDDATD